MHALWAPWRMEYIGGEKPQGCIFCHFPAQEGRDADRQNLVLGRTAHAFAVLNRYPYNNGHLMVIPRRHTADFPGLGAAESADLHALLQLSVRVLGEVYRPDGFNLGMNLGRVAGAGIPDHLHYHVVPRWNSDTNFMPVISETKVMIEHLTTGWEALRAAFDRALGA